MHQKIVPNPRFYKLTTGEDIVAYEVADKENCVTLKQPMAVFIENNFVAGRQLVLAREWMPPIIVEKDVIDLPKSLVVFSTECSDSFALEFKELVEYFYCVEPVKKKKGKVDGEKESRKVVPFILKDDSGNTH